jgi:hypothetical protein
MGGITNNELEIMWKEASRPRHAKAESSVEMYVSVYRASRCNIRADRELLNKRYYSGIRLERLRKITTTSVRLISTQAEISTCGFPNTKQEFIHLTATLSRNF